MAVTGFSYQRSYRHFRATPLSFATSDRAGPSLVMPRTSESVDFRRSAACSCTCSCSFRADDRDSGKARLQSDVRRTAANSVPSAGMLSTPRTVTDSGDDTSDLDLIIK